MHANASGMRFKRLDDEAWDGYGAVLVQYDIACEGTLTWETIIGHWR